MIHFFNNKTKVNMMNISLYKTYRIFFDVFYMKTCNTIYSKWLGTRNLLHFVNKHWRDIEYIFLNDMLWQLGWYKWLDGSFEMAAMSNSTGTGSLNVGCWRCEMQCSSDDRWPWKLVGHIEGAQGCVIRDL